MNIVIGTVLIGGAAIWLFCHLPNAEWRRASLRATGAMLAFTLPRVLIALMGAGLFAELLPADQMQALFGRDAGLMGAALAAALGPLTPGGAFVSFAIGAAALKAGAAPAMVLGYVTSWALFSIARTLAYEAPILGRATTLTRFALCLPVPFLVMGLGALWS